MQQRVRKTAGGLGTTAFATAMLSAMGAAFRLLPRINRQLRGTNGTPYQARLVFKTFDKKTVVSAIFAGGGMTARPWEIKDPDVVMNFQDNATLRDQLSPKPKKDIFSALLDGEVTFDGNLSHLARFSFLTTEINKPKPGAASVFFVAPPGDGKGKATRTAKPMTPHEGVEFLSDPAFADKSIDDWLRLKSLWEKHFTTKPAICSERASLLTDFHRREGFEADREGQPWDYSLRQGRAIEYILKHRQARIEKDDLLLGTTTNKRIGVQIFPELGSIAIWPELNTVAGRTLNPYDLSDYDRKALNEDIFPYWIDRNLREWARRENGNPRCQRLEEKWVLYFIWKAHAISHTIADMPWMLDQGLIKLQKEAQERAANAKDKKQKNFHQAVALAFDGVLDYAKRMALTAEQQAEQLDPVKDAERIKELQQMAACVRRCPAQPAESLQEALNAIWIVWTCLHQENMNAGLSIGRLDAWLQPYLAKDLKKAKSAKGKQELIDRTIELCGAFFVKCQDHLPLVPDIGNRLFGGSSSDQVITLGGVDAEGKSSVCDMTYILLKVTEMLGLRDPNVNARYNQTANPRSYLRRLTEVNVITGATPSIHNDEAVIDAMQNQGFTLPHARDWSATGCVEPTSCGRHFGHTGGTMFNLVAPLELALYNGSHPLLREQVGDKTGDLAAGQAPETFAGFLDIYYRQLQTVIDYTIEYNNQLGVAHQTLKHSPLLSGLIQGTQEKGKDLTLGGAIYNSSGVALVALADVVDSLMAVKKLIYEEKVVSWPEMIAALETDFVGQQKLLARIINKVPKFGGPDPEPQKLANELIDFLYQAFCSLKNYRGGHYSVGYWSMSNHVAFGVLSGALPSGRLKGKAFTPGITPSAQASKSIMGPIHAVSALDARKMPNNIAFNVKLFPANGEAPEKFVDNSSSLAAGYFKLGGMQLQFNMVTSETLRQARDNPAAYRNLLVRISGYNAYFVELNPDLQTELIERADYQTG